MTFKFKLILALLIEKMFFLCSSGCLKCLEEDSCYLCDQTNDFYWKDKNCQQSEIPSCVTYDMFGKCLVCDEKSYLVQ